MRPWLPRSLTTRILAAEVATIAVAALLLPLLLVSVLGRTTRDYQDRVLFGQARAVAAGLAPDRRGGWRVTLPQPLKATFSTDYDGRAFAVVDGAGRLRVASRYAALVPWRAAPRGAQPIAFRAPPFAGVTLPATADGLWVIVTQDQSGPGAIIDDIAKAFQPRFSAVLLVVLVLLPIVNSLLIRRLVLSVRRVSAEATAIGPQNLHARLGTRGLPSEVTPLVSATNALLARLEQSFHEQGQFVANVAHELRTPLAALRLRAGVVEDAAVRAGIDRQIERLTHVISQLRDLGALERGAPDRRSRFDLAALAAEMVAERADTMAAADHPVALVPSAAPVEIVGHRALVEMALTNLLDNAVRHTPAGTRVIVSVAPDNALRVEDDGPGLTAEGADMAGHRFWRADHKRSDSAGLGLSIVRRIMEAHGGRLAIANCDPHGASLTLHFPEDMAGA